MIRIDTPDGRRAWAFLAVLGGCIVMTVFAALALYWNRANPGFTFWNGLAAHAHILVGLTGLIAMFVKRSLSVTRDGVRIDDKAGDGAQQAADAAQDVADELKGGG